MRLIVSATLIGTLSLPAFAQPDDPVSTPQGHEIEVYLAENALQAMYTTELDVGELGMNEIRAGFLFSEARDFILAGDMLVDVGQRPERPRWMLDVGPRVYGALLNVENQDIFAIAVGGRLSYLFRQNGATTMSVSAFYAPDIITFGNADNVVDVSVRFETQLTPATRIFLGYRSFEFDLLDAKRKIDDDIHIGFRRRF
ncbi:MAG TPA: YfaZ family outer membrane protein [Gammaproteobacteria bacterium]|nr:YfaZ family outer membrane protein [Gammaproteobacteria bacterium]